jgi:hypothetical protein
VRRRVNPSEPIIDCMHVYTYRSIDGSTGSARPLRSGSDSDRRLRCSFSILCVVGFNLFFFPLITFHFFCWCLCIVASDLGREIFKNLINRLVLD